MTKDLSQKIIELMDLFDGEVTTADQIDRPQQALDREAIDDFNKRNPMAGGGMLVQPGFGGVRQGYAKDNKKTITSEFFKKEYKNFQKNKNNIGTDGEFAEYLNKNYTTKKGSTFATENIYKIRKNLKIKTPVKGGQAPPSVLAQQNKINKYLEELIPKLNSGEKFYTKEQVSSMVEKKFNIEPKYKTIEGVRYKVNKFEPKNYPTLNNLDSVETKLDNTLKNMLIENKPLNDYWYNSLAKRTGLDYRTVNKFLPNLSTYNVIKDQGAKFLKNRFNTENFSFLKDLSFSDQLRQSLEIAEGTPRYTGMGKEKFYSTSPKYKVFEFAKRNFNLNKGNGDVKFFTKNGKPISWQYGLKIPYKDSYFTYDGKKYSAANIKGANNLTNIEILKKNFPEVYNNQLEINKLKSIEITDPLNKNQKISFEDLVKRNQVNNYKWSPTSSTFDILHGKDGVAIKPFTDLSFNTRDINQLELGINQSTILNQKQKNIITDGINKLGGSGNPELIVNRQIDLAKSKNITNYTSLKEDVLKKLTDKKFGRVADVIVKASKEGGFGDVMQRYCARKKAKGGRMFYSNGSGCPAARDNPKEFLQTISQDPKISKFFKSSFGQKAATAAARVTGNVLNPSTLIGGEVAFVLADGFNNFSKGMDLAESFDRAFIFKDFKQFDKNIMEQAQNLGYDENQLNLLNETININRLDNRQKALEYGLNNETPGSEDLTMGFTQRLADTKNQLDKSVNNYIGSLDKMGFDLMKDSSYDVGFRYLDNVFKKRTQDQMLKTYDKRKQQVDPTSGTLGNILDPILDVGAYTQPFKFAADVVNPFTKNVPLLSDRQREAKYLKEMDPRELYLYNKQRGFTLDDIEAGTSPQIRQVMDQLGGATTGQGFFQQFEKGGRAGFKTGSVRKGVLSLIDDSVKKTSKDTTPNLDALIKKTLDEDFFDKKDRIIDQLDITAAKKRKKYSYNQQVQEEPDQLDFYDDIVQSNFKTKTGPFFDRRKKAGGGILKQAGDSSGPPPESGPNSQGLQGLMKRGIKI